MDTGQFSNVLNRYFVKCTLRSYLGCDGIKYMKVADIERRGEGGEGTGCNTKFLLVWKKRPTLKLQDAFAWSESAFTKYRLAILRMKYV